MATRRAVERKTAISCSSHGAIKTSLASRVHSSSTHRFTILLNKHVDELKNKQRRRL